MRKNDLSVFKLEEEGFKITLKRGSDFQPVMTTSSPQSSVVAPLPPSPAPAAGAPVVVAPQEALREIKSPMPGTFYASPSPDSPPYVQVGREVSDDSVVGIIEAMKVMNEITAGMHTAGMRGTIVEIVAQNGKPVEYDQVLFRVR